MVIAALINKKSLSINGIDELVFGSSVQLITGIICLVLALVTGWSFTFDSKSILMIVLMIGTYTLAVTCYYTGLKRVDLSEETILSSTGAIWSLILGVLIINESFGWSKIVGVLFILIANTILFWGPSILRFGKYEKIILFSTIFYAQGAVWDKLLSGYGNSLSYVAISFGLTGLFMLTFYHKRTIRAVKGTFLLKAYWKGVLTNGLLYSFAFWALFSAYLKGGEVSRMFPMTLSTSVLVPIFGIVILKEYKGMQRKLIASAVLIFGMFMIGR
ncbi:EamA family transporter [Candidatus Woesebacteria bacterium]|nr:MAG: EamA family transporter [Candidatus Woesebacteria bacterium]